MSAGLGAQVGLGFGLYARCVRPNLRKPDEQGHGKVREPAPKVFSFRLKLTRRDCATVGKCRAVAGRRAPFFTIVWQPNKLSA